VHRRTGRAFDRFQIEAARLALTGTDDFQQSIYFGADLLLNRFRRFFSCGVNDSSTGRAWQTFSLISSNSLLNSRKR
jgi:hypothetical protein